MSKLMNTLFAGLVALAVPASAQDTYNLKLAGFVPGQHGFAKWLDGWAADIEAKSDGRLTFEILHGAQMGPPPKYYDLARNGQADITWVLHGATPGRFPLTEISNMPFLFCSAEQATKVINNPELRKKYLDPEHRGVKVLLQFATPPGQAFMRGDAIVSLEGFSGKAIRPASRAIGLMVEKLAAKPVGLPPTAIAEALQKGTIDGTFIDYSGAAFAFQLGPFLDNITEMSFYSTSFTLAMNPDTFDGLPADLQELITASVTDIEATVGGVWDGMDAGAKQALINEGVKINTMPAAEFAKVQNIGVTLTEDYVAELDEKGLAGTQTLAMMRQLAKEVGPIGFGCQ